MEHNEVKPPWGSLRKSNKVARARVTIEMWNQLMKCSKRDKINSGELIRRALQMYFKATEKDAV